MINWVYSVSKEVAVILLLIAGLLLPPVIQAQDLQRGEEWGRSESELYIPDGVDVSDVSLAGITGQGIETAVPYLPQALNIILWDEGDVKKGDRKHPGMGQQTQTWIIRMEGSGYGQ